MKIFREMFPRLFSQEKPADDKPATTMTDGSEVYPDHREINPATGMQQGYIVLSEEERAKGFVRPVRRSYIHVGGPGPEYPLEDLTEKQREQRTTVGYVKYEKYPDGRLPAVGRYWTQAELDRIAKPCRGMTTMGLALAETYARDPSFYGGTFCAACGSHFPVGKGGEFVWADTSERVGT